MAEQIEAFRQATEKLRSTSSSIEDKIRTITVQMDDINKKAAEKPEKGKNEKPEPFQGHSVALDTLFVIAFFLVRLLNQKVLSDITRDKLTNYFEQFKQIIDIYSFMLVIGYSIDYPTKPTKEGEGDKKPAQTGGAEETNKKEVVEILDNQIFLRELKAFYSYLFMTVSSNTQLKGILQYPSNPSFKERTDWLGFLTPKEDAVLIKKESLQMQDRLFQNIKDIFELLFDKFQIVADTRSDKLAEQSALVDQLNQKVDLFNSAKSERQNPELEQNALDQTELLETIMKEGPVPILPMNLKILAQQLADGAETVKQQLYAEATPDKEVLKRMYESINKLLDLKVTEATASATPAPAPTAPAPAPTAAPAPTPALAPALAPTAALAPATPLALASAALPSASASASAAVSAFAAASASVSAAASASAAVSAFAAASASAAKAALEVSAEKAAYGSIKNMVSTKGGYRLRKSRKVQHHTKKKMFSRSKRN